MSIKIADKLSLPVDMVTQVEVIIAKRRAGKSYTMRKAWEQILKAGQQVVVVDPKGDQWGIRSSGDGKRPGFPVLILGGEHGDLPLEAGAGEVIAKLVVEEQVSVLLDLSQFRKHEIATFMTAFLENLYRLKAQEKYRTPVKLIVDEADAIAPQKPQMNETRMLGAIEDIVRRGGQRGIGCTLVTQRSAVLNKNVLTQAQILVVLRTIAPQDLAAIKAWIDVHGTVEEGKALMDSLPSLPIGDAWFWSPGWPTEEGIFRRVHVAPIETFDSGATPKPGQKRIIPKNLADVDLGALQRQMAATIEKAKAEDPKLLRKRIAELEATLKQAVPQANPKVTQAIATDVFEKQAQKLLSERDKEWRKIVALWKKYAVDLYIEIQTIHSDTGKALDVVRPPEDLPLSVSARAESPMVSVGVDPAYGKDKSYAVKVEHKPDGTSEVVEAGSITGPEQRVLNGIAWMENIGVREPAAEIVAFLSGYAHVLSKGFTVPRGALRTRGLISYPQPGKIALTDEGRALAQFPLTAGTSEELQAMVLERLDGPKQRVLKPLLEAYPADMSAEDLCQAAGYMHPLSKGFTVPRGKLRTFGLIEYPTPGRVRAANILFI